jgi:ubiquitin carboxyl-terminal hydrolase 22/27/51
MGMHPDRTFAGSLLSTVTCARCGTSTATEDPTLDISLELRRSTASTAAGIGPGTAALTLDDCLRT